MVFAYKFNRIPVWFIVVGTSAALSLLPVQLTEHETNSELCHGKFTFLHDTKEQRVSRNRCVFCQFYTVSSLVSFIQHLICFCFLLFEIV